MPVRLTIEQINEALKPRDIHCISYAGSNKRKSIFQCDKGHVWHTSLKNVKQLGTGCPYCSHKAPLTLTSVNNELVSRNIVCVLYGGSAINKSIFKCHHGHFWVSTVNSVKDDHSGCHVCSGSVQKTVEDINNVLNKRNITCVNYGGTTHRKSTFTCANNHEWVTTVNSVMVGGRGCPHCVERGFNFSKPATLYVLMSEDGSILKIGISSKLKNRINTLQKSTPFKFNLIRTHNGTGEYIYKLEQYFHHRFKSAGLTGFDGCTEWLKYNRQLMKEIDEL